jgi:hypothetical protein
MKSRNFRSAHVEIVTCITFKNIENKFILNLWMNLNQQNDLVQISMKKGTILLALWVHLVMTDLELNMSNFRQNLSTEV